MSVAGSNVNLDLTHVSVLNPTSESSDRRHQYSCRLRRDEGAPETNPKGDEQNQSFQLPFNAFVKIDFQDS
jgi:hypothetical protein